MLRSLLKYGKKCIPVVFRINLMLIVAVNVNTETGMTVSGKNHGN